MHPIFSHNLKIKPMLICLQYNKRHENEISLHRMMRFKCKGRQVTQKRFWKPQQLFSTLRMTNYICPNSLFNTDLNSILPSFASGLPILKYRHKEACVCITSPLPHASYALFWFLIPQISGPPSWVARLLDYKAFAIFTGTMGIYTQKEEKALKTQHT